MDKKQICVRRVTFGDGVPKICIPVTAGNFEELEQQILKIRMAAFEMLELRVDYFTGDALEELQVLRERMPDVPILFTCRTKAEGGMKDISLKEYARVNREAAKSAMADFVDLELNRGEKLLRELIPEIQSTGTKVLLSYHDFKKTPDRDFLLRLLTRMQELGADMTKAAVMPRSEEDVLTLLETGVEMKNRAADRPYIVLSMGQLGQISRLAGSLTGSAVTFATAGAASAPGQLDAELVEKCRRKV